MLGRDYIILNVPFPERALARNYISLKVHCQKLHFLDHALENIGFRGNVISAKCIFWQVQILENKFSGKCSFRQVFILADVSSGFKCSFW